MELLLSDGVFSSLRLARIVFSVSLMLVLLMACAGIVDAAAGSRPAIVTNISPNLNIATATPAPGLSAIIPVVNKTPSHSLVDALNYPIMLYGVSIYHPTVVAVNTLTRKQTALIDLGRGQAGMQYDLKDPSYLYVANAKENSISIFQVNPTFEYYNTEVATLGVGIAPASLAESPDGRYLYSADYGGTVSIVGLTFSNGTRGNYRFEASIFVGSTPDSIAVSPDGKYLYVACYNGDKIAVIDTATRTVVKSITVGDAPADVTVSPDGSLIFVANSLDDTISVVDAKSQTVARTLNTGKTPVAVTVAKDGGAIFVACMDNNTIARMDPAGKLRSTVISTYDQPCELGLSADGKTLYVTFKSYHLAGYSTSDLTKTYQDSDIGGPKHIAVSPEGSMLVVTYYNGSAMQYISLKQPSKSYFQKSGCPGTIAFSPDGSRLYVSNSAIGTISVIDTYTNTRIATIQTSIPGKYTAIDDIVFDPSGKYAYASNPYADRICVIDTATNKIVDTLELPADKKVSQMSGSFHYMAISPSGSKLYVSEEQTTTMHVFSPVTGQYLDSIHVNNWVDNIALSPDGNTLYAEEYLRDMYRFDTKTDTLVGTMTMNVSAGNMASFVVSPDGTQIVVVAYNDEDFKLLVLDAKLNPQKEVRFSKYDLLDAAYSPDGDRLYTSSQVWDEVQVFDPATFEQLDTIYLDDQVLGLELAVHEVNMTPRPPLNLGLMNDAALLPVLQGINDLDNNTDSSGNIKLPGGRLVPVVQPGSLITGQASATPSPPPTTQAATPTAVPDGTGPSPSPGATQPEATPGGSPTAAQPSVKSSPGFEVLAVIAGFAMVCVAAAWRKK